ncbi:MAG: ABC transporter ATP-binding protein/permease [Promicromonosporaceae bacterium]|nr:ABC transporter ATP-binding protein/permease [Promicromonosporaceae bacterium]
MPTESARNWRTLISFLWPYRGRIVVGSLLAMVGTVAGLWTPRIVESVIEHLWAGTSVAGDVMLFGALTLVYIVAVLTQWAIMGRAAEKVVYDVREALVARFLRGRVAEIRERATADLVARATADAPLLQVTVTLGFVSFITAITGVVGSIVLMGVIDGLMLGVTLAAVAVLGVAMAAIMPKAGRERALAQEAVGAMSTELDGSMRALRTIKAAGAERSHSDAVLADAAKARNHGIKALWAEVMAYETGFGGMQVVTVVMVAFGAWRVTQGELEIPALVAFIMYTQGFIMPLMQMADGFSTIQQGLAASKRIAEAQEIPLEEEAVTASTGAADRDDATPVLAFESVTARYKPSEDDIVRGLDLVVPRRGHLAIVGPSGAGKSSLVSLALRFLSPRSGTIRLDGVPYEELTYAQVRSRFAYVEQEPPVLPGTVRDNLEPTEPKASDDELYAVLEAVDLADDVAALENGLDTELVGATMTGGGRQRLAIARALLTGAEILVLDDATSQIGGRAEEAIHRATRAAAQRAAVVTIATRATTAATADTVVVLEEGRVRATGTHAELLATDALYRDLAAPAAALAA